MSKFLCNNGATHCFWSDGNPPECMTCKKTKQEIAESVVMGAMINREWLITEINKMLINGDPHGNSALQDVIKLIKGA